MSDSELKLPKAPIVEAVLDIECDMPPAFDMAAIETKVHSCYSDTYPTFRRLFFQEANFETEPEKQPKMSVRHGIQAFQFRQQDEKQLVQIRALGFSFNRLDPYTSLDDYLPEIERTWKLFVGVTSPIEIRIIRLRYINRILLPLTDGHRAVLADYFKVSPKTNLRFSGFVNQHTAVEIDTGHQVNIVLASQPPEAGKASIIFDICVGSDKVGTPDDWPWIKGQIMSLRSLKNRIFQNSLTEKCLNLFQP